MPIKDGAEVSLSVQDLSKIRITEFQPRYPERLQHYIGILEEHPHDHLGVLLLKPSTDGYFEILDGHHRFLAYVMTGRQFALALTVDERNIDEQAADDQRDLEALRAKLSAPPRTDAGEAGSSDLSTSDLHQEAELVAKAWGTRPGHQYYDDVQIELMRNWPDLYNALNKLSIKFIQE